MRRHFENNLTLYFKDLLYYCHKLLFELVVKRLELEIWDLLQVLKFSFCILFS